MSRALALALAMVVLALPLATPHANTQAQDQVEVKIRWVAYINPTDGYDYAYGVCIFGDYIAVVGGVIELPFYVRSKPYLVLLRKSDGGVVREWIGSERGAFYNCISVGGKLYAVGYTLVDYSYYGLIYVFDVNLNILTKIIGKSPSEYYSLAYDGKALYLGGWIYEDADGDGIPEFALLVEKRALDESLSLVNSKKTYFDPQIPRWIYDIGVEPSTGRILAVGFHGDPTVGDNSLIVIFDGDLRELRIIDYPPGSEEYLGRLRGIAFNGRYAYISGWYGVAKFSVDGELVAINRDSKARDKIVYGYGYLYAFGVDRIRGYDRHVLYIHDTNLNLVKSYVLSENISAHSYFYGGRPALEGNNIYVAGLDHALGIENSRVVVYSLSIEGVTATTTMSTEGVTATTTATTTIATVATVTTTTPITQTTTVTEIATVTMGVPTTAAITTTTPAYITVPTTITASDRALPQLIVAGLAAVGIVLVIAFLLLKRRR